MFEGQDFSLSPINFFQMSLDCHLLKSAFPSLAKAKGSTYELPDTSAMMNEEAFAKVSMGFSKEGIELYVVVNEPIIKSYPEDISKGDSVEIFIDTRDLKTSGFNTRFCHHFFFFPEAVEGEIAGEVTKFRSEDAHELCSPEDLKLKVKKTAKGYSLEIFIPAIALHGYDPEQFDRLGFNYRINRANGNSQHFSATSLEYKIEEQPSLWASFTLKF